MRATFYLYLLSFIFSVQLFSQPQRPESLIEQYKVKIEKYLDKEKALSSYYSFNDEGIYLYASLADKQNKKPEFKIFWNELQATKALFYLKSNKEIESILKVKKETPFSSELTEEWTNNYGELPIKKRNLRGVKIAIDAGHLAGDMATAKLEKKFISMKANPATGLQHDVEIIEGELTLTTAKLLKQKLEAEGAIVMLTRDSSNNSAFGKTFENWLTNDFKNSVEASFKSSAITETEKIFLLTKAAKKDIFRDYFSGLDMRERANKINLFRPDITVVIHYNVDEKNTGWIKPSVKNYNMVFTGGSFMKDELKITESRVQFLRLLITDAIINSVELSERLIKNFKDNLQVPSALPGDADYLNKSCMYTEKPGIYNRNLTLTQLIHGTTAYCETLYQDNIKECILLDEKATPERISQVADAYYKGIKEYFLDR